MNRHPDDPQLPGVNWARYEIEARAPRKYLYVFAWLNDPINREYAGCYKIGHSTNVPWRHENRFPDTVIRVPGVPGIPNTEREEAAIHRRLAPYRVPYLHPSDPRARRGARNGSSEIYYPATPVLAVVDMLFERHEQYVKDLIHGRDAFWWGEIKPPQQNNQDA